MKEARIAKTGAPFRFTSLGAAALAIATVSTTIAHEVDPYAKANNTWITISGSVESVSADAFMLDYGDGVITVEMDDGDRDADAYKLVKGDKVTVSGKVDDDFFEIATIEASSVFVENLGTTFFASAIDEETSEGLAAVFASPIVVADTIVTGTVTTVGEHTFTVDTGLRELNVDPGSMPYDPLDDEGYLKLTVGDRVKIRGDIERNLFENHEIEAEYIVKLHASNRR